ncbi:alpha/beta fold hydrolase [Streptomyces sp. HO565]|uniref:alpha/beta fold hydrolase n=1 Tax=Streptomyces sp. HO565 TaxID=2857489 RepID=UPI0034DBB9AD
MMNDHTTTPLRTGRAAVNGTSLHYRTAGSGPAVVLLHGVPKTGYHWRHLVPKLTPHHTVVVLDLRGLGDSARPTEDYDSATMSDDIAELMARLGHESYAVIGEDWGALIGYQLTARHRDHATALVFAEALFPGFGFEDHTALTAGGSQPILRDGPLPPPRRRRLGHRSRRSRRGEGPIGQARTHLMIFEGLVCSAAFRVASPAALPKDLLCPVFPRRVLCLSA